MNAAGPSRRRDVSVVYGSAVDFSRGGASMMSAADFSRVRADPDADSLINFEWTIENFGMCPEQSVASPEFGLRFSKFNLRLIPRISADGYFISANLCRLNDFGAETLRVKFRMSIGRRPFHESHFAKTDDYLFRKGAQRAWNLFVTRNELVVAASEMILPVVGFEKVLPLTIKCDVLSLEETSDVMKHLAEAELLSNNFARTLDSGEFSDAVLQVEDKKFNVHKIILKSRCPTLYDALRKFKHPNKYTLDSHRASDVQALLKYLYTGILDVSKTDSEFLSFLQEVGMSDLLHAVMHPPHKSVAVVSEIPVAAINFKWPVNYFSKVLAGDAATYPAYLVEECGWNQLEAVLTVEKSENQPENVKVTFKKVKKVVNSEPAYIHCKVTAPDGKVIAEEKDSFKGAEWVLKIPIKDVERVVRGDVLWLVFHVVLSKPQGHVRKTSATIRKKAAVEEDVRNLPRLQADFGERLLLNQKEGNLSDVLLKVETSQFRVHKVFLCTRSPVFARMFSDDYLERQKGQVVIEDVNPSTLFFMLRYIYSGFVKDLDVSEAMLLYAAADKYELLSLKERCADIVKGSLEAENVGEVLILADAHQDSALKAAVYDFISNHPKEVADSKDLLNSALKDSQGVYPELLEELLKRFSK